MTDSLATPRAVGDAEVMLNAVTSLIKDLRADIKEDIAALRTEVVGRVDTMDRRLTGLADRQVEADRAMRVEVARVEREYQPRQEAREAHAHTESQLNMISAELRALDAKLDAWAGNVPHKNDVMGRGEIEQRFKALDQVREERHELGLIALGQRYWWVPLVGLVYTALQGGHVKLP